MVLAIAFLKADIAVVEFENELAVKPVDWILCEEKL
jgi:hypothetical protein